MNKYIYLLQDVFFINSRRKCAEVRCHCECVRNPEIIDISNGQCVDVNETPKFNFCDSYNEPYVYSLFVFFHDAVILIV